MKTTFEKTHPVAAEFAAAGAFFGLAAVFGTLIGALVFAAVHFLDLDSAVLEHRRAFFLACFLAGAGCASWIMDRLHHHHRHG